MNKKILLILILLLTTGCYNYTEINDLKLVNGIYIDYKDNKYNIKFDTDKNIESSGTNISDAFRNFEESIDKRAYYAHLKVLIISKNVIKNHFDEVIEYFLRNNEIRNNFYLVVSDNISNLDSTLIKNMIKNNNDVITSSLFKNILTTYLDNKKIILPLIENNTISGSVIKTKTKIKELNIDNTRLYKIIKNNKPNIIYKNINIYHSKVKYKNNTYFLSLDAELKEKNNINTKKELKQDLEKLLNKKVKLKIDINRNGQIINEE